jgi:hypothetical protein
VNHLSANVTRALAGVRTVIVPWAASRTFVFAVAIVTSIAIGYRGSPPIDPSVPDALQVLGAWDTTWYLDIARNGYEQDLGQVGTAYSNFAFLPLLPAIAWLALALHLNPFIVLLVAVHVAFLAALALMHHLTVKRGRAPLAPTAVWCLALIPTAAFASLAYTEAVTLALILGAAAAAVSRRYLLAGLLAAGATMTRPSGILAAILVAHLALVAGQGSRLRQLAATLVPSVAALGGLFVWMQAARGRWNLPLDAQRAWDRGGVLTGLVTDLPDNLASGWDHLVGLDWSARWFESARDLGFGALAVVLLVRLWRSEGGLRSPWVLYSALALALPLSTGSIFSLARFSLLAFPLMWPLAEWISAHRTRRTQGVVVAGVITMLFVVQLVASSP